MFKTTKLWIAVSMIVALLNPGKVIPGEQITPTYITIHNTGCLDAPARNLASFMKTSNEGCGREASWHATADDKEIIQSVPFDQVTWNTASREGNYKTIAIEICIFSDPIRQKKADQNGILLTRYLMQEFDIPIENVVNHQSWGAKTSCPAVIMSQPGGWEEFKKRILTEKLEDNTLNIITEQQVVEQPQQESNTTVTNTKTISSTQETGVVDSQLEVGKKLKVLCGDDDPLWVYDKPDWNAKIMTVKQNELFTIDKVLNVNGYKMYQLKSGLFITANKKYVEVQND